MKQRLLTVTALALPILSACGEKNEQPYIDVKGNARIEKAAEIFEIEARILERSKDRDQSLAAASQKLDELRDKMMRLEGLESVEFSAEDVTAHTVRPEGCDPEIKDRYREEKYPENCEALDYLASVKIAVTGEPASAAGPAVSLLNELNVETASSLEFKVKDPEAAQDEARQIALSKAMQIAQSLAERAGADAGPPLNINYSERGSDIIIVTGSRVVTVDGELVAHAPRVTLKLPTKKVTFDADVTVRFALKGPASGE